MNIVKTAISLDKNLHAEASRMARKIKVSRSRLFAIAMKEFLDRRENEDLLRRLNESVAITDTPDELGLKRRRRASHRRLMENRD